MNYRNRRPIKTISREGLKYFSPEEHETYIEAYTEYISS